MGNPSQPTIYPPEQGTYPPQQGTYPPQQGTHPPQQGMYSPQQGAYPRQQGMYPSQQGTYPPQQPTYPPQQMVYPPQPVSPPMVYPATPNQGTYVVGGNEGSNPMDTSLVGEDVDVKFFDFTDQSIRRGFIRKVYSILSCQLLFTMAVIAFFSFCQPVKYYVTRNLFMLYMALGVYIVLVLVLICVTEARRKAPLNMILLLIFTAATSYMMGTVSATVDAQVVMAAAGITAAICFSLTLFAFQTKYDFTMCSGFLVSSILALLLLGIYCVFVPSPIMHVVYCALGIVLFSFSLVYHTQLMIGGKHRYSIHPEEYVFAALTLYLDVLNIFLRILRLMR